jgi:hypothetical protein
MRGLPVTRMMRRVAFPAESCKVVDVVAQVWPLRARDNVVHFLAWLATPLARGI